MHWLNFIWISQIWISLAAVSFYLSMVMAFRNYVFVDIKYIIVLFSGTWTTYTWYHRNLLIGWLYSKGIKNTSLIYPIWMILATISGYFILVEKWVSHLMIPAMITIAYIALQAEYPPKIEKYKAQSWLKFLSLWFKPACITIAWILACWPPGLSFTHMKSTETLAHFLWILGIALFFEEKDRTNSSVQVKEQMAIISVSWVVLLISSVLFYTFSSQWIYLIIGMICILTAASLRKKYYKSSWYYYLLLDGFIFLPALIGWYKL